MINQVILVGTLTHDVDEKELEDGRKLSEITLAIAKPFKNNETGEYETDYVKITLWQHLSTYVKESAKKGSVLGIKGRISTKKYETQEGKVYNNIEICAENVVYISK